ncbi:MAG: hypothetical protein JSW41_04665 [Candidatus Aenigmatarchaeota archaeon]|nr:MAG: hypothetical protein JSW41_04665 [Candidatus Aenigmarchaeota archaeon]
MAFNPQQQEKREYDLIDEGLYGARVARVIELGDQDTKYGVKTQVVLGFTIPSVTMELEGEEKQRMMWTFPMNQTSNPDSKLMKYIKAIKADATHMDQLVGQPCMLEIAHTTKQDGTTYANISNVTKPMAGMDIPEPDCDTYMYEFANGEDEIFDKLGEFRQNQVKAAINWEG